MVKGVMKSAKTRGLFSGRFGRTPPSPCVPELAAGQESVEIYTEGDTLYADMQRSLASARTSIRLESYIFAADEIGWAFAEILAERAMNGVSVRLHIDTAGSMFRASKRLEEYLRSHGVELRWFHRWNWRSPLQYNRRSHRKLAVVDSEHVYLGGFNIHRENSQSLYGTNRWRDTHIRMSGQIAREAAALFDTFWRGDRKHTELSQSGVSVLVPNDNASCRQTLHCLFLDTFDGAEKTLYLTTPYFVPDHHIQQALKAAGRRQVDVRLLVPGKSDVAIARWAAQAAYADLLAAGVRIYEYQPRMLHAKTAVIDGTWSTVGTANMDYRSLFSNYELNLVSRDTELARRLHQQFLVDIGEAEEVRGSAWANRRWHRGLFEGIGWAARRWL